MLEFAASVEGWTRVVRRCAWCQRCADADGEYRSPPPTDPETVATDGMCPACAARMLAQLAVRRPVLACSPAH
jgi:hypothetical protein